MDKSEVIILSSDDENDTYQFQKHAPNVIVKPGSEKSKKKYKTFSYDKELSQNNVSWRVLKVPNKKSVTDEVPKNKCQKAGKENPEVVDLVDSADKSPNSSAHQDCSRSGATEHSHIKLDIIDIDPAEDDSGKCSLNNISIDDATETQKKKLDLHKVQFESNHIAIAPKVTSSAIKEEEVSDVAVGDSQNAVTMTNKDFSENLKFFEEFVELCGSLEAVVNDRIRLTKKLMKRFGEAESSFTESQEFRDLIQKCKEKVNRDNLYLIAKDITAELSFRKQIKITSSAIENCQRTGNNEVTEVLQKEKKLKKHTKFIKRILKKLDKLGCKIRELEQEEVDLSDEEGSSYVRLQRYRERFCQIYKKLCKHTNDVVDADDLQNRRICFTESKYPTINKCIEVWLNKVKRFPDFTDIMKLLESQSSSLGLPSNRESLRVIAVEIFQQVGAMLQRRRKYDLWDSFCGFLDDKIDPANSDPALDKVLKDHFEARIKKEQQIFQHYSELQERERLQPEEVPEEEANDSPVESGNDDEKEIEEIENDILRRLDLTIKEDAKKEGKRKKCSDGDENKIETLDEAEQKRTSHCPNQKQSKNNYKNCKSLKWRSENLKKSKSDSGNSGDSNTGPEYHKKETPGGNEAATKHGSDSSEGSKKSDKKSNNDSDLPLLTQQVKQEVSSEKEVGPEEAVVSVKTPVKRTSRWISKSSAKKKCVNYYWKSDGNVLDFSRVGDGNANILRKSDDSFEVRYCLVFADSVFDNLREKENYPKKRKVFRDMTNVNRLMELHGKDRSLSGLFAPSFSRRKPRKFEKPLWKRRFGVHFGMVGAENEKCALSQEEKTEKSMKSGERGKSEEKNNSQRANDKRDSFYGFFSGRGGESHEDGDEDRNRKNGRTDDDVSESKHEEEEEDEDDRDENETEEIEHSSSNDKTEETRDTDAKTQWPSEVADSNKTEDSPIFIGSLREVSDHEETDERILGKKVEIVEKKEEIDISEEKEVEVLEKGKMEEARSGGRKSFSVKGKDRNGKKYSPQLKNGGGGLTVKESNAVAKEKPEREIKTIKVVDFEKLSAIRPIVPKRKSKPSSQETTLKKENGNLSQRRTRHDAVDKSGTALKCFQAQCLRGKVQRRSAPSASDEERVKRFLMHSPSSISITPPRKLTFPKPPSDAALQALATLRNLKDISATIVKGKPKAQDDVMVIGGPSCKRPDQNSKPMKRRKSELPVISNVQSIYCATPKIVTVEGNVSGFESCSPELRRGEKSECDSTSIRISNVWGSLPNNFTQDNEHVMPGCSSQNSQQSDVQNLQFRKAVKKKSAKKKVEYVVLE